MTAITIKNTTDINLIDNKIKVYCELSLYICVTLPLQIYLDLSCVIISSTSQLSIKHKVSSVFVVIGKPFLMRCKVFADIPSLKMS